MEKTYLKEVGERLYECRTQNVFSRRELAEKAGVSVYTVRMMERGEMDIGIEDAVKICKELDCSVEYILTGNCGLREMIALNQKILKLPDSNNGRLQKIAQAFWDTCPR